MQKRTLPSHLHEIPILHREAHNSTRLLRDEQVRLNRVAPKYRTAGVVTLERATQGDLVGEVLTPDRTALQVAHAVPA